MPEFAAVTFDMWETVLTDANHLARERDELRIAGMAQVTGLDPERVRAGFDYGRPHSDGKRKGIQCWARQDRRTFARLSTRTGARSSWCSETQSEAWLRMGARTANVLQTRLEVG